MKLPAYLTTVTPFSKTIAFILFVSLPFVGFKLGTKYQQLFTFCTSSENGLIKTRTPETKTSQHWLFYENSKAKFQISYPSDWTLEESYSVDGKSEVSVITGKEGKINLSWDELGGACPKGYEKLATKDNKINICRVAKPGDSEQWGISGKNFGGHVVINNPAKANQDTIFKILSTIESLK